MGNESDGWGAEIDFRTNFEKALVESTKKPMFLFVLEGGPGTLKTVYNALECAYPVILVNVSFFLFKKAKLHLFFV